MDTSTTRSLREVMAFPFQESTWKNRFLIGSALCLAGILIPLIPLLFVYGYLLQVMRAAIRDGSPALPAWEDWGKLLVDGLKAFIVALAWLLPGMIVSGVGLIVYFVVVFITTLASDPQLSSSTMMSDSAVLATLVAMGVLMVSMLLGTLLSILGLVPLPVAAGNLASTDRIASAFYLRELWNFLNAHRFGYFLAWVIVLGLSAMLYMAVMLPYMTMVLICTIPIVAAPLGFYVLLVAAAMFGLTYREARVRLAEKTAVD